MKNQTSPQYTPYLQIKNGGYAIGEKILTDFTLRITRKTTCHEPGKKFGIVTRYIKFIGRHSGESEEFEMPIKAMGTAVGFRCFCLSRGNYNAILGGRELCYLIQDLDAEFEHRKSLSK